MRAGERRVVRESPVAMRASPSREKSGDFTDVRANQYEKPTEASAVKSEWAVAACGVQATVAADGRCAGAGSLPDTFGMAVDQQDQLMPIH